MPANSSTSSYYQRNKHKWVEYKIRARSKPSLKKWIKDYNKQYKIAHADEIKEKRKIYLSLNKKRINDVHRKYVEKNFDKIQDYNKTWRDRNKNYRKSWNLKNRDKVRIYKYNRRKYEKDLTVEKIEKTYQNNLINYLVLTCELCNKPIGCEKDNLEHLVPLSRGGTNNQHNLAVSHMKCNLRKGDKTYGEWLFIKNRYN